MNFADHPFPNMKMSHEIAAAMRQYGGSFVRELATLWVLADDENRRRIEAAWPDLIEKYAALVADQTAVS